MDRLLTLFPSNGIMFFVLALVLYLGGCGGQNGLLEPEPAINGTVVFYHFDEVGGPVAADSSGNGYHGTLYGTPRVSGKVGSALQFGSANSRVEMPRLNENLANDIFQNQKISIDAWLYPTVLNSGAIYQIVGDGAFGLKCLRLQINDGQVEFLLHDGASDFQTIIRSTASLGVNTWTYVAVTFDGSDARIYLNGTLESSLSIPFPIQEPFNPFYIGVVTTTSFGYDNYFSGIIDELRISNVVLSDSEIQNYYQQTGP